jgi:hypothetical protein
MPKENIMIAPRVASCLAAGAVLLSAALPAQAAIVWDEAGDAGPLLASAQSPLGVGDLSAIRGRLEGIDDIDLYALVIPELSLFSATTVGANTEFLDTQLFLFDASGRGVISNDDTSEFEFNATLPAGAATGPAGLYYLAVAEFADKPTSDAGRIFPDADPLGTPPTLFTDLFLATGPGGGLPLSGWDGDGFTEGALGYEILLTGAEAAAVVPEPASLTVWIGSLLTVSLLRGARKRGAP